MLFTMNWLQKIFPNIDGDIPKDAQIDAVVTDSRVEQQNALFIPLVGDRFDGHLFAEQAIKNGAVALFWEQARPLPASIHDEVVVFFVKDTLKALQTLASVYREEVAPTVVGITGSNGKTTTKDLAASVLQMTYKTHFTKGNFNNHIGLPLTILEMPRDTEVLIVEMGMNHFGEIEELSTIAKPDYAIVTNIGESHIEHLGSRAGIAQEKLDIRKGLHPKGLLIIDGDESLLDYVKNDEQTICCGFGRREDYQITNVNVNIDGTSFVVNQDLYFSIGLHGKHHAKNASYIIALAKALNVTNANIQAGFDKLRLTSMRFEWLTSKTGGQIINDAYNASATSMKAAIEVIKQISGYKHKVLVLGDIFELGKHAKELHESVAEVITEPVSVVYTYGEHAEWIVNKLKEQNSPVESRHFTDKEELINALNPYLNETGIILFKASRGMKFETIVNELV